MRENATEDGAEVALKALGWLEPDSFALFLNQSGIEPAVLREQAANRETARAVLDFLLANEALLVDFCKMNGSRPN